MKALAGAVEVVHGFIGGGRTLGETLADLSRLAADEVGSDMAGLTLSGAEGPPATVASTDPLVPAVEDVQYATDDGPCLAAYRENTITRIDDTSKDDRWRAFCEAAAAVGIRSSVSVPVVVAGDPIGALNFYAKQPARFADPEAVSKGQMFAGHMAIASAFYEKSELAEHLGRALENRAAIEQAKGVIMASTGCSPDEAFELLRQQSQSENRKLREIAVEIVANQGGPRGLS